MRKFVFTVLTIVSVAAAASIALGIGSHVTGSSGSRSSQAMVCPARPAVLIGGISVPAGPVAGYCQDQLVNAANIMNAARSFGIGPHTQAIGVMTAMGETGLRNLDHGDAAGADSRGLFQQRANGAWGSLADRMDPYTAARNYFAALIRVPGWKTLSPTQVAHAVQINQDPNYYTRYWADAQTVVATLGK
jgi:hypothetical protein